MTYLDKLKAVDAHRTESRHAERICSELTYLDNLSAMYGGEFDAKIEGACELILGRVETDGVITATAVREAEDFLSSLAPVAKSKKEIFVGHGHIDMNWRWGYNETAVITVDTFRTMLLLMREYPEFTYAQSQASTYEIIEKYAPEMLPEIRQRIEEGRWEVTAAEWVEPDKNMPSGESLTRQILEAKKYLTKLLCISEDRIKIDFVPDTFGHAVTVPEILADAGIKYLYHCRGCDGQSFYRYTAPSGKSILAYREYGWYNKRVGTECFENVPKFCAQEGLDTFLCVYGVGDHGGGATRLDIERILEYRSWPLTPDIRFGTYEEFFRLAEESGRDFPEINEERNFLFSGCYTTQSRIKMANRIAESRIYEAEALDVAASLAADAPRDPRAFEGAWRNILFGHFHDILPGSGVIETREYALGRFQDTLATLQTRSSKAMNAIADCIDTSGIEFDGSVENRSEGGGAGYRTGEIGGFRLPSTERGRGKVRVLHVFNTTAYDRDEVTELTVWDYNYDNSMTEILNDKGEAIPFVPTNDPINDKIYWGHTCCKYLARVKVPAFGYTTLTVRQKPYEGRMNPTLITREHTDHEFVNSAPIIMENAKLRAVFSKSTGHLTELTDLRTGERLIDRPSCFLRYIEENPVYGMTSWRVGPYMKCVDLNEECGVRMTSLAENGLFSRFSYEIEHKNSKYTVEITLRQNSEMLDFAVTADFKECPVAGKTVPQIAFAVPVSYAVTGSLSEIPYGTLHRAAAAYDVPSHGAFGLCGEAKHVIAILAETKYGFRLDGQLGQVALLRMADNPDPYSDMGIHTFRLGVAACDVSKIGEISSALCHPLSYVAGRCHKGTLGTTGRFGKLPEGLRVSAVKNSEDQTGTVIRIYSVSDEEREARFELCKPVTRAYLTDTNEKILSELGVTNGGVSITVAPREVKTVKLICE